MIPDNVLNTIYAQLQHPVTELAKYFMPGEAIRLNFGVASVKIHFNKEDNENND